ncbi:ABC transporter permease [Jiangella asiatica]|uniref:ABC transporter permease n=1 Tax=Jiangella asiatica TaxID=2530372 RepID=A0A4R5DAQ9_9ACTN|nr:ABC transporter permease [Jiangella asiatica]TDE09050.1 ABC transporter permease [Jiangella asiatica]
MLAFIVRRLVVSAGVLLAGTFLAYCLVALSGDPLARLRQDNTPGVEDRIAEMTDRLNLDTPVPLRYLQWLGSASKCLVPFAAECDLGQSVRGQDVTFLLGNAVSSTLQLITVATFTAMIVGVIVGIVTALRQYSRLDYATTLASFFFVSLPLFWFAVLLKQYVAIDLNDWLADPTVSLPAAAIVGVISGLIWASAIGGDRRRVWISFGIAFAATAGALLILSASGWFASPGLGPVVVTVVGGAAALGLTALLAGFRYRHVLYAALATAAVGAILNLALDQVLSDPSYLTLIGLLLLAVAIAGGVGYALGGLQRKQAIQTSIGVAVIMSVTIFIDRMLSAWGNYFDAVDGRVVATFGSRTPNYDGGTWGNLLDTATHLLLPTIALILVSVATYSRYTRASMLEVMNQDYVRTARSKGLTERTVIVRHAFRNGLIPITTLMAFDVAGLMGGAVITETVFAWQGMGFMFVTALRDVDPNPAMAFFLVTGLAAVVFNMLADIAYAYLDPRIRLS